MLFLLAGLEPFGQRLKRKIYTSFLGHGEKGAFVLNSALGVEHPSLQVAHAAIMLPVELVDS